MSKARVENDVYPTPAWCVDRLLERCPLPDGEWLEPCAGDGAIVRALGADRAIRWTAVELRGDCGPRLEYLVGADRTLTGMDFLALDFGDVRFDACLTNPPYSRAMEFVERALPLARVVAMLLRLNFLGSAKRRSALAGNMPDAYVLPNRPQFRTEAGTDMTNHAWLVWPEERGRTTGKLEILAETPKEERSRR